MRLSEHLVGRAEELDSLELLLARLDEGGSSALELTGEPGIGKTRLLSELAARADARGHTVLSGRATELERDLPFSVFVDALDEYLQALDPRRLAALGEGVRVELATVFPSLETHADRQRVAMQEERYRTYRAVRQLLELLARRQPVVLALDDVHWADPASVELLGALLRRPPSAPVLVVLAVRPRQMDERLSVTVEGREKIDRDTAYVMVANHQSLLDILVFFRLFTHFKWVSKIENFRVPVVGWNMSLNRYIKLRRGDKPSVEEMMAACERTLAGGNSVMMFPEGTRSPDGKLKTFKHGAFTLAKRMGTPLLPIVIDGTAHALPKRGFVLRGTYHIRIRVLDEILPASFAHKSVEELMDEVWRVIAGELPTLAESRAAASFSRGRVGASAL